MVRQLLHVRAVPQPAAVPALRGGLRGGRAHRPVHQLRQVQTLSENSNRVT